MGNAPIPLPTVNSRCHGGLDSMFLAVIVHPCRSGGMVLVGCPGPPYLGLRWFEPPLPGVGRVGGGISLVSAVNGCRLGGLDSMFILATTRLCGLRGRVFFGFLGTSSLDSGWRALRLLGAGRIEEGAAPVTMFVVIRCI